MEETGDHDEPVSVMDIDSEEHQILLAKTCFKVVLRNICFLKQLVKCPFVGLVKPLIPAA